MVEVALAWSLHQSGVASVLADVSLSEDLLADLDDATADLTEVLGPNLNPWQSNLRYN